MVHSDGTSTYAFQATAGQYQNSLINRQHLFDIEDGFFGELSGLGRRPLQDFAYSGDAQAGGYRDALELARKEANDGLTDQLWMMAGGTLLVPAGMSLSFAAGAEMLAFGQNPLAYSTILIPRVTPYVDEMAAGLAGFPTGTIFGAGVGTATSKALTYADEAEHALAPLADDLGHLSGYGRAADDLAVPQLEDMAGDVLRHSDEAVFRYGPDGAVRSVGGVPNINQRHLKFGGDLGAINESVELLGQRALRNSGGDPYKAEAIFEDYLKAVDNRLRRVGSNYGIEIQPASLKGVGRVPAFIYLHRGGSGTSLITDSLGEPKLFAYPRSKRLDAGVIDLSSDANEFDLHYVVSGFDITTSKTKPNIVKKYQEVFGDIPIYDIRLD